MTGPGVPGVAADPGSGSSGSCSGAGSIAGPPPRRRQRQLALVRDEPTPIVKWAGGKTRVLGDLVARMPADVSGCYFEPFVGGAALFFRVRPGRAVLGDSNRDLIELYAEIARDPSEVRDRASRLAEDHGRDPAGTYYAARETWNDERTAWDAARRAATFLYLNKASFNGLFRVNRAGRLNVPIGRPSGAGPWPSIPSLAQLLVAQDALRRARLCCADFVDVMQAAQRGDFVYFDPPYSPTSKTASFSSYTDLGFGPRDHQELARLARDLVDRGVRVMVSSSDVPGARDLYPGFSVSEIRVGRSISSRPDGRGKVGELILTGGYDLPAPIDPPTGRPSRARHSGISAPAIRTIAPARQAA